MQLIDIPVPDGTAEAYVARPSVGQGPGVLLFMDAIGLRPQIAAMAERIASWGYVVLAPNVFYRDGSAAETSPDVEFLDGDARDVFFEGAMKRVRALTPVKAVPDIAAYLEALRTLPGVGSGPVGTTGYCMGARLAVRTGTAHPDDVAAVGGFHGGGLVTDADDSPHRGLPSARAEFVFGHADQDRSMPPEAVETLGAALADAGLTATNEVYPGAGHGYTMADTAVFDEAATERHFDALQALFSGPSDRRVGRKASKKSAESGEVRRGASHFSRLGVVGGCSFSRLGARRGRRWCRRRGGRCGHWPGRRGGRAWS